MKIDMPSIGTMFDDERKSSNDLFNLLYIKHCKIAGDKCLFCKP